MWNSFKIWLNRNDYRIFKMILIIIAGFLIIKGANGFFKNELLKQKKVISEEINSKKNNFTEYSADDFEKVDITNDEYNKVNKIVKRFLTAVYNANQNNDSSTKQVLLDMCAYKLKNNLSNPEKNLTEENVLEYLINVNSIDNYTVNTILKMDEKNDVAKYIVNLNYNDSANYSVNNYIVINIDKNNNTFSYEGNYINLGYIYQNCIGNFVKIEDNGNNRIE